MMWLVLLPYDPNDNIFVITIATFEAYALSSAFCSVPFLAKNGLICVYNPILVVPVLCTYDKLQFYCLHCLTNLMINF